MGGTAVETEIKHTQKWIILYIRFGVCHILSACWHMKLAVLIFFANRFGPEGKESQRQAAEKGRRGQTGYRQLWVLLLWWSGPLHVGTSGTGWDWKTASHIYCIYLTISDENDKEGVKAATLCWTLAVFTGATKSHLDFFKKHRAARIDHYVIEVNKLIIRLEKVCLL